MEIFLVRVNQQPHNHRNLIFENKSISVISFLYVCMVNTIYLLSFVETPRKFIGTDEDPSLRIESSAIINLCGVSTKLNK